ncbi:hypothetical protein [Caudoviricetes sp.]|nr:hypothetical protein [Caudoviricetes sp.]
MVTPACDWLTTQHAMPRECKGHNAILRSEYSLTRKREKTYMVLLRGKCLITGQEFNFVIVTS